MKSYLTQCAAFTGRKAALLVTQAFPFPWMGGNQAISRLKRACESKGAAVLGSGIVNWSRKGREKQIEEVVDRLGALFR